MPTMPLTLRWISAALIGLVAVVSLAAQDLYVRVIDVGQGESVVARMSPRHPW